MNSVSKISFRLPKYLIQENTELYTDPFSFPLPLFSLQEITISFTVMTELSLLMQKWPSSLGPGHRHHFLATLATAFLAASSRSTAEVMGSPLLLRIL